MRPIRSLSILFALTALVVSSGTAHLERAPVSSSALPAAQAQARTEPRLVANLYDTTITYRTTPFSPITAELRDADGMRAEGGGFSGEDGWGQVQFAGGGAAVLEPGKTLTLTQPGGEPLVVTVPSLGAAVEAHTDRVIGVAPAGANVTVEVDPGGDANALERAVTADPGGRWALDLSGEVDLLVGEARGVATYADNGLVFNAAFAELALDLTLGTSALRGQATPGVALALTVRDAQGERTAGPLPVLGGSDFTLNVGTGPFAAGDVVEVEVVDAPVSAATAVVSGTLPALTILIDPADDMVGGTAPPEASLRVTGDSLSGEAGAWSATAAADGSWSVEVTDQDLGAGWRARASLAVAPGLRAGAIAVVEQARIGVGLPFVQGRMMPGSTMTFTLRAADGTVRRSVPATADDRGDFGFAFDSPFAPSPVAPRPGERVEIAVVQDDPVVLIVPELTATADTDSDVVRGTAPPGAAVRARIDQGEAAGTDVRGQAGPDGRFALPVTAADLRRPASGVVEMAHGSGNLFYTSWAAIQLAAVLGNNFQNSFVTGNGVPGRWVRVELLDPEGRSVASAEGPVFGGFVGLPGFANQGSQFFLTLQDITGAQVNMRPGDTLRVTSGDEELELEVPPLDAVILVQSDSLTGTTAPGATVDILVSQTSPSIDAQATVTADAAGNWNHDFGEDFDLLFGDLVQLIANVGEHNFLQFIIAPGLLLDADQSLLLGSLAPDLGILVTVARDGRTVSEVRSGTAPDGALMVQLVDAQGAPLRIEAGDQVTVLPMDGAGDVLRLTVPELVIEWDAEADTVGGTASEGSIVMLALLAYPRTGTFGVSQAWPAIGADGRYDVSFVPLPDVRPGMRLLAVHRPPSGNYVIRQRVVPILSTEVGGPSACGYGAPNAQVRGDLRAAGSDVAAFEGTGRWDGYFAETWRDDQMPRATVAGEVARAALVAGEQETAVTLPDLQVELDPSSGFLRGSGPANTDIYLGPATPCAQQQQVGVLNINVSFANSVRSDDEGRFQAPVPGGALRPGGGAEVSVFVEGDHRAFRQVITPLARMFLGEARVDGRAGALASLDLVLQRDGAEVASAALAAGPTGAYAAELQDDEGSPVAIRPGDVLRMSAGESEMEVPAEDVNFDWSPGSGEVLGTAPADRALSLQLRLASGGVLTIERQADADGRFAFTEGEVPPRAPWSMDDVVGVRVTMSVAGGHQVVRQTEGFAGGAPPADGRTIYLPWARNGRAAAAAVLDAPAPGAVVGWQPAPTGLDHAEAWPTVLGPVTRVHRDDEARGRWWARLMPRMSPETASRTSPAR